eukprot:10929851-Ditylum_brightwellii.AAC.1
MDRRVSQAKDAARTARRKLMMGYALSQDSQNPAPGVFIDRSAADVPQPQDNGVASGFSGTVGYAPMNDTNQQGAAATDNFDSDSDIMAVLGNNGAANGGAAVNGRQKPNLSSVQTQNLRNFSSPFLAQVVAYMQ